MAEHGDPVLITHIGGELVELPGSLGGIRAGLPDDAAREAFDAEIDAAPLTQVPLIAARWGLPQEAIDEDEAIFRRLEAGDHSGMIPAEELDGYTG
ncbi:hypothetical protein [Embleya hyalina]|uniref:Uncharacterized protein n=1 Tax=Embleya hyalina TaxID=516124 RepID=A0A401Z407_9ACTN|nr:hypothetical protein [Embleya hyalina]GCE01580.1 hypothetical protein EHYA_09346 [Embleya hyalina]